MRIGVLVKQVPATETKIVISEDATGINTGDVSWIISPYDEHALEAGIALKEAGKAEEVVVITLGGTKADKQLRDALARGKPGPAGADRGVWLDDEAFVGVDPLGVSRALAAIIQREEIGLVLAGKHAIDDDNCQVPAMLADLLGWPEVSSISELEVNDGSFTAHRPGPGGAVEVVSGALPAVLTADKALNTPRYSSLPGIMKAKKKPLDKFSASDLELGQTVGPGASRVQINNLGYPAARPEGRVLEGEPVEVVAELVRLLREEVKVL